jgi:hypothetical protein
MRILKVSILITIIFLLASIKTNAQTIVCSDLETADSLIMLMDKMDLKEKALKEANNIPRPRTASGRKDRLRIFYQAKVEYAKAEHTYFAFCSRKAPDMNSRLYFNRIAWSAKFRVDKFQNLVYAYTDAKRPAIQR